MGLKEDLSEYSKLISDMFYWPDSDGEWEKYMLTNEQVAFFNENGYVSNIKLLETDQVDQLNEELKLIMDPAHPNHHLYYEFHSNESADPDKIIFHSLGHWRITTGFHDVLWNANKGRARFFGFSKFKGFTDYFWNGVRFQNLCCIFSDRPEHAYQIHYLMGLFMQAGGCSLPCNGNQWCIVHVGISNACYQVGSSRAKGR